MKWKEKEQQMSHKNPLNKWNFRAESKRCYKNSDNEKIFNELDIFGYLNLIGTALALSHLR